MNFDFELDRRGYIKKRETFNLEFKQAFSFDGLLDYAKSLVGMANNKGGQIIFGIKDSPHETIGMQNDKFNKIDPLKIDSVIREYFSTEIEWESNTLEFENKEFGQIYVKEARSKPIICKKYNQKSGIREGAIYYRYRAVTKEIEYAELSHILQQEREKETKLWIEHIQRISTIGPKNVRLLDLVKREIKVGNGSILIDKNIVDAIKFIKEGQFDEVHGAPTLKLMGEITGVANGDITIQNDVLYPYFRQDLGDTFKVDQYKIACICWKLKIKGDRRYHSEVRAGKKSGFIQKYSEAALSKIKEFLIDEGAMEACVLEYKEMKKKEKNGAVVS